MSGLCLFEGTCKPPLYCSPWMTQAWYGHPAHDPHVTHSTRVMGKRDGQGNYHSKNPPRLPAHRSGPSPTTRCAYVWPRPGGSCRCTKVGALLFTPLLVHGQSEPHLPPHLAGQREGVEAQDRQNNAKTRDTKSKKARWTPPAKPLPGRPPKHRQEPCRDNLPNASRACHP